MHARHGSELCNLVFAFSSLYTPVDFLQTDEIRLFSIYHIGNALQIQLLVHPDADVHPADRAWWLAREEQLEIRADLAASGLL